MIIRTTIPCFLALLSVTIAPTHEACNPACAKNAICKDNVCQCKPNPPWTWGNGTFRCYRSSQVAAEIKEDTTLTNFNNDSTQFYFPCRYLITHVRTELKVEGEVIGNCTTIAFGVNRKFDGKIAAHGLDVAFIIRYKNGIVAKLSTSSWGSACDGKAQYHLLSENNAYKPNGPWLTADGIDYQDTTNGVFVVQKAHPAHGLVTVEAPQCGFSAFFKAYDECLKIKQNRIPGISVAVDRDYNIIWLSSHKVVALPPKSMIPNQSIRDIKVANLSIDSSLLIRAFESGTDQTPAQVYQECKVSPFPVCKTDKALRKSAIACFWMLKTPKFIRCVGGLGSEGGSKIIKLFKDCVKAACSGNLKACTEVRTQVQASKDKCELEDQTVVTDFLKKTKCPF